MHRYGLMIRRAWAMALMAVLVCAAKSSSRAVAPQESQLRVKLVELGTGKPVSDASVYATWNSQGRVVTGPDGEAIVPLPLEMNWPGPPLVISPRLEGWVPMSLTWQPRGAGEKPPEQLEIVMEKATTIGGTVVDQEGKPLPGAMLNIRLSKQYAGHPLQQLADFSYEAITADENGAWTFDRAPEKFDSVAIGAIHQECLDSGGYIRAQPFGDVAGLQAGKAQVKLARGTPVEIEVHGRDGQVIPASLGYGTAGVASNSLPGISIGRSGKVKLGVQPGSTAVLTVVTRGYAPELKSVQVGTEPLHVAFDMLDAQTLTGRVVDKNGAGVSGAQVQFGSWRQYTTLNDSVYTDTDGVFRWTRAPADEVLADVLPPEYARKRRISMKAGQENLVTVFGLTKFKGTVVDGTTGALVKGYRLSVAIGSGGTLSGWQPEGSFTSGMTSTGDGTFEGNLPDHETVAMRVIADGYLPSDSPPFPLKGDDVTHTFKLEKGAALAGELVNADGKPVPGVQVILLTGNERAEISNGRLPNADQNLPTTVNPNLPKRLTDAAGKFSFPPQREGYRLLALSEEGYAIVEKATLEKDRKVILQKWANVEGIVKQGTKVVPHAKVAVAYISGLRYSYESSRISISETESDDHGRYVLPRIFAGRIRIWRRIETPTTRQGFVGTGAPVSGTGYSPVVVAKPGETVEVQVGGIGRPVTGRLDLPVEWKDPAVRTQVTLETVEDQNRPVTPVELMEMTREEQSAWLQTDPGRKYSLEPAKRNYETLSISLYLGASNAFRVASIPAGRYLVFESAFKPPGPGPGGGYESLGSAIGEIVVPEIPGGMSDDALDLGTIPIEKPVKQLAVGDDAAGLVLSSFDGKAIKLSDFKGKNVVLNVWATHSREYLPDRAALQPIWDDFGKSGRAVMLGLSMDLRADEPRSYLAVRGLSWPQAHAGPISTRRGAWGMLGGIAARSSVWIIGPDGKVVAANLQGAQVREALEKAMGK